MLRSSFTLSNKSSSMKKILLIAGMLACCFGQSIAQKAPKGFSYIPMGMASVNGALIQVDGFYMGQTEVTNGEYRDFLREISLSGDNSLLDICKPDSAQWLTAFTYSYNAPYVDTYHWHPAFKDYPAVNISSEAAVAYCRWRTAKYGEGNVDGKMVKGVYRLPTEAEWVRAARGDHHQWVYTWGDPKGKRDNDKYLRNEKGEFECNFLSNSLEFKAMDTVNIGKKKQANSVLDNYLVTGKVNSYRANLYGIYCMCGNVAEMVESGKLTKGGSFNASAYSVKIDTPAESFSKPSPSVGFRMVFIPSL